MAAETTSGNLEDWTTFSGVVLNLVRCKLRYVQLYINNSRESAVFSNNLYK